MTSPEKQSSVTTTEESLKRLAAKNYVAIGAIREEFEEDFGRFLSVKRLVSRYLNRGQLRERLIINHLVVLFNVFQPGFIQRALQLTFQDQEWVVLNTFLVYMQRSLDTVNFDEDLYAEIKKRVGR